MVFIWILRRLNFREAAFNKFRRRGNRSGGRGKFGKRIKMSEQRV